MGSWSGTILFLILVGIAVLDKEWAIRALGLVEVIWGYHLALRKRVEVGAEGFDPSFQITGFAAVIIGSVIIILGVMMLIKPGVIAGALIS